MRLFTYLLFGLLILVCIACSSEPVLPTVVSFDTATLSLVVSPTETSRPTKEIPPTYTPTVEATFTPTVTALASPTVEKETLSGTLYYIYNGDSIAAIQADGSNSRLIETFGVDVPLSDLSLSPDQRLMAFVAPGNGASREIYVINRDGSYRQQVSCLGFQDLRKPTWAWDSDRIAFWAAPNVGATFDLYETGLIGANECPDGNQQDLLIPLKTEITGNIAWHPNGEKIFYSIGPIYAYDMANVLSYQFTAPTGFGPDFALVHHKERSELAFLRTQLEPKAQIKGGSLVMIFDTDTVPASPYSYSGGFYNGTDLAWNQSGAQLMIVHKNGIRVNDFALSQVKEVVTGLNTEPIAAISPDGKAIAYRAPDINGQEQLYIASVETGESHQISFLSEGHISDLVWAAEN
ncbi:hypothetical protein MASR2M15_02390 [Anaerolineales bacterium]